MRILRIKNAKFSGYCFYRNTNVYWDFQICISVPLILLVVKKHIAASCHRVRSTVLCWKTWFKQKRFHMFEASAVYEQRDNSLWFYYSIYHGSGLSGHGFIQAILMPRGRHKKLNWIIGFWNSIAIWFWSCNQNKLENVLFFNLTLTLMFPLIHFLRSSETSFIHGKTLLLTPSCLRSQFLWFNRDIKYK